MRVVQGENVWQLVRTDRAGNSESEVVDTVGPAMGVMLREAQPSALGTSVERAVATAPKEWRIGAARPVQLAGLGRLGTTGAQGLAMPAGTVLGTRASFEGPVLPTVAGTNPWFVLVRFWWRAPSTELPYPVIKVDGLGRRTREAVSADWYLDRAVKPAEASPDPGDETWTEAQTERVSDAAAEAVAVAKPWLIVGGVLVGLGAAAYVASVASKWKW
jgi:hypothetical protein